MTRKEQTITLPLTPERRRTLTIALREYVDARLPIDEYVDRRYPAATDEFRHLKIKSVGRRVRQVRAVLFALYNANANANTTEPI